MPEGLDKLTPREREVLEQVAAGRSNKEIAVELSLKKATIKGYVASILVKLDVPSRTAAAGVWFQHIATRPRPDGRGRKAE